MDSKTSSTDGPNAATQPLNKDRTRLASHKLATFHPNNGKIQEIQVQRDNIVKAIAVEGRSITALADYKKNLDREQAGFEARKLGLDTERNELLSFLNDKARIIQNAQQVRTYLKDKNKDKNVVRAMIETFVEKVEVDSDWVTIHYRIPMPPNGPGQKVRVETVPLYNPKRPASPAPR